MLFLVQSLRSPNDRKEKKGREVDGERQEEEKGQVRYGDRSEKVLTP